ncbi:hypothetical protein [Xenorhabdus kozodoii]|uniref:Uncharacterized protein n=1 Tax=Xenorhabdus kozodoii TaxID=351676 RepID=A0A2D0KZJ1_9GAMM|nr:hypothetical protein [Xenorhabdus kozodoii]PHM68859.1 hypothetical protein Xkoz_03627 [Xenorhabdus kozodoii]
MKLDLGKYVITSDSRKFILNIKRIAKTGDRAGEENLEPIRYYCHLNELIRDYFRMELDSDDIKTLQQLSDKIDLIAKELAEKLNSITDD